MVGLLPALPGGEDEKVIKELVNIAMSINLIDRQKDAFRQLVARKDELYGRPFSTGLNGNVRLVILQLQGGPEFELKDLNEYVQAGLLDQISQNSYLLTNLGESAVANDFQETGTLITDLQAILLKLDANLRELQEREAKHGGNAPLDLLNQIGDHEKAIDLTRGVFDAISDLQQEIGSLNIAPELKARLVSILGEKQ